MVAGCTAADEISFIGVILPWHLLSWTRCRVYCQLINAEEVALGESLRLVAAERPHSSQTIDILSYVSTLQQLERTAVISRSLQR